MALKVYNYLSRELERFRPFDRESVRMYVCGPTVYDYAHLGHVKIYVAMDVLVRYLTHLGYRVRYVRNFTDMGHVLDTGEDRLMRGARRAGMSPMEVAEHYIWSFQDDMDALGLRRPNISPRSTCHIPEIIAWVQALIDTEYAYEVEGNVYFSLAHFPDYGHLARCHINDLQADTPAASSEGKRDPADFPLWKRAEPEHLLRWHSPWGEGYPGTHIECSVMANKYLGQTVDIHGGGLETIFPHGDCEIAQSVAHNRAPYANVWMLVGSLLVNGQKMSTSLGNFLTVRDALKLYSPEAIRYFVLQGHYRDSQEFSRDALQASQREVGRLHQSARLLRRRIQSALPSAGSGTAALSDVASLEDYRADFRAAMDNDLNTPEAIAVLMELTKDVNSALEDGAVSLGTLSAMDRLLRDLAGTILGILPEDLEAQVGGHVIEGLVEYLLDLWHEFCEAREWSRADAVRSKLDELGIAVESGPYDTIWRFKGGD